MGGLLNEGFVPRKTKPWLEARDFQPHLLLPGREAGLETELMINHAYMMEIPKVSSLGSFWVGEHIHVLGNWCTPTPKGQKILCWGPFQTLLYISLCLAVYLYQIGRAHV